MPSRPRKIFAKMDSDRIKHAPTYSYVPLVHWLTIDLLCLLTCRYHISVRYWVSPILSGIKRKRIECSSIMGWPKFDYFLYPRKYDHFAETTTFFWLKGLLSDLPSFWQQLVWSDAAGHGVSFRTTGFRLGLMDTFLLYVQWSFHLLLLASFVRTY